MDVDSLGLDDGDEIAELLRPLHGDLLKLAFGDATDLLGVDDIAFDLENTAVKRVLDRLAKKVRAVADTTKEQIQQLVGQAAEEGWGVEKLARQIRAKGEIESVSRSRLIAQTESATAYSQGSLL